MASIAMLVIWLRFYDEFKSHWSFLMQILKQVASTQKWTKYSGFWIKSLMIYISQICQDDICTFTKNETPYYEVS